MSNTLELFDSCFQEGVSKDYYSQCAAFMETVDYLQEQFVEGKVDVVNLQPYNPRINIEAPVWYKVQSFIEKNNKKVVDKCLFFSSHYIGRYSNKGISIIVNPRFGSIFNYLVGYATNIYIPYAGSEFTTKSSSNAYWLIALIWKAMLNKALTAGQIPKSYQSIIKNQKNYRGHLSIARHIHTNICNASRFYCSYKKLSMDNTINRTIRMVYSVLKDKGLSSVVSEFEAYDKYLCSMGVDDIGVDVHDIDNVRYTRLTASYKPVMDLSKTILANRQVESSKNDGSNCEVSYFIDISELWEMYLLKLLQNNLPYDYHVYSPNTYFGDSLLDGKMREIRPDILIEKEGRIIMIIDAKYKNYTNFGSTAEYGISREDLYQMTTYLFHYGTESNDIVGLFSAPVKCNNESIYIYSLHKHHKIGLVNIDINGVDDNIEELHRLEDKYISTIIKILHDIC